MAELSGSLASIGLVTVAQLLGGLRKSGDVLIARGSWIGQLSFDRGQLTAAALNDERGFAALEFIAASLREADFEFSEGPPTLFAQSEFRDNALSILCQFLNEPAPHWASSVTGLSLVPRPAGLVEDSGSELVLTRSAVRVLLDIDGQRSVRDLASQHGLLRSCKSLGLLHDLGLIEFTTTAATADTGSRRVAQGDRPGFRKQAVRLRDALKTSASLRVASEVGQAVLLVGALTLGARAVVQNFRVEGISMQPNFVGGQVLVINRAAYFHLDGGPFANILPAVHQGSAAFPFGGPRRGDVVVFRAPPEPDTDFIKRIIGLPGDHVAVRNGSVFVNGTPLQEPYIAFPADYNYPDPGSELVVPDENYFVLGDNRPDSLDSHFGWFVPINALVGKAWVRYWPPTDLGVVQTPASGANAQPRAADR
jgi:signal peptidase I